MGISGAFCQKSLAFSPSKVAVLFEPVMRCVEDFVFMMWTTAGIALGLVMSVASDCSGFGGVMTCVDACQARPPVEEILVLGGFVDFTCLADGLKVRVIQKHS